MRWWSALAFSTVVAAGCARSAPEAGPSHERFAMPMAAPTAVQEPQDRRSATGPRLSYEEAQFAARSFPTDSEFCQLAGPPPSTCTVGLSALIQCNEDAYRRLHTFPAPSPQPAVFNADWDGQHDRWLVTVKCPELEGHDAAEFGYYESRLLLPLNDPAWSLAPGLPVQSPR